RPHWESSVEVAVPHSSPGLHGGVSSAAAGSVLPSTTAQLTTSSRLTRASARLIVPPWSYRPVVAGGPDHLEVQAQLAGTRHDLRGPADPAGRATVPDRHQQVRTSQHRQPGLPVGGRRGRWVLEGADRIGSG